MHTIIELITNMAHSTLPGTIGVSLIFVYFAWILFMAVKRIKETLAEDHH